MIPVLPATCIDAHPIRIDEGGGLPLAIHYEPELAGLAGRVFGATYHADDTVSFVARLRLIKDIHEVFLIF